MTDAIAELVAGRWIDPDTDEVARVPVSAVHIAKSIAGDEAALVKALGLPPPFAVITDQNTYEALGRRVEEALESLGAVIPIRLSGRPHPDDRTAAKVMREGLRAGSWIGVGSGTINDLAKFASARQGKRCAVFATAPSMNGYTSVNASITVAGHKKTLAAQAPEGVFIDLEVLAKAPTRLIRAGFGDAICRSTAEADWRLSHALLGTAFKSAPFSLFADLEDAMIAEPEALAAGDFAAIERLARALVLSGFGMTICGSSAPASQGEHLISHYMEMMHPPGWEAPLHGEQIAATTVAMARLQDALVAGDAPRLRPGTLGESALMRHYGTDIGKACWDEARHKTFSAARTEEVQAALDRGWADLQANHARHMRPAAVIENALRRIGAPTGYRDLNTSRDFFASAIWHAREIRNRYTFLDLAADSGRLVPEKLLD